jgi:hypothetical protein
MTGPVDPGAGEAGPAVPGAGEGPAGGPPPGAGEAPPPAAPPASRSNTGLIIGIIVAILAVLGGGGALIASLR